jgi:hypothetical protein
MTRVPLLGGAYETRSMVASASEAINLYSEKNPEDGQPTVPATSYPTPGLGLLKEPPYIGSMRTAYRASNGLLYNVIGPNVYYISETLAYTYLGSVPSNTTPLWFSDNGSVIVLVDGSSAGWVIDMATNTFAAISDPSFYGGTSAAYQDTYFIFNRPDTPQFYISLSNVTFDMLTGTVGAIYDASIIAGGSGYVSATYTGIVTGKQR